MFDNQLLHNRIFLTWSKKPTYGEWHLLFALYVPVHYGVGEKQFRGYYVNYSFDSSDRAGLAECERLMRIDNDVLRYLLIKVSENVDVEARKAILKEKEEKARKQVEASIASANEESEE